MSSTATLQRARKRRRWPYVLGALLVLAGVLAGAVAARGPSRLDRASYVYSADGELLGTLGAGGDQRPIKLKKIAPVMRQATIAIEDRRFYEHEGIDYRAI